MLRHTLSIAMLTLTTLEYPYYRFYWVLIPAKSRPKVPRAIGFGGFRRRASIRPRGRQQPNRQGLAKSREVHLCLLMKTRRFRRGGCSNDGLTSQISTGRSGIQSRCIIRTRRWRGLDRFARHSPGLKKRIGRIEQDNKRTKGRGKEQRRGNQLAGLLKLLKKPGRSELGTRSKWQ